MSLQKLPELTQSDYAVSRYAYRFEWTWNADYRHLDELVSWVRAQDCYGMYVVWPKLGIAEFEDERDAMMFFLRWA